MSAYLICDVSVRDRAALMNYLKLAEGTVEQFAGRYLAQAGALTLLEGDWSPETLVIVEFPSIAAAKEWYRSEAYAPALEANAAAMLRKMLIVEGVAHPD